MTIMAMATKIGRSLAALTAPTALRRPCSVTREWPEIADLLAGSLHLL
jgi:hypothetical protein